MRTAMVVLAGGSGARLRAATNKAYLEVGARPLAAWSLRSFEHSDLVDRIVLVHRAGDEDRAKELAATSAPLKTQAIVAGGATRHESERAGVEALAVAIERGEIDVVAVHDAARPFVRDDLLARVLRTAHDHGGAVPCLGPPAAVLLQVAGDEHGTATDVVPAGSLRRVQTPQAFRAGVLLEAHRLAAHDAFDGFDTAECVERYGGVEARVVAGDPDNVKVTFADDLPTVEALAARWIEADQRRW